MGSGVSNGYLLFATSALYLNCGIVCWFGVYIDLA